eukprot:jgi/Bigna1/72445/fgenesh1_pg.20_\
MKSQQKNDSFEDYEVERIILSRYNVDGELQYLIKWKGYKGEDNTWEPSSNISPELIEAFNKSFLHNKLVDIGKKNKSQPNNIIQKAKNGDMSSSSDPGYALASPSASKRNRIITRSGIASANASTTTVAIRGGINNTVKEINLPQQRQADHYQQETQNRVNTMTQEIHSSTSDANATSAISGKDSFGEEVQNLRVLLEMAGSHFAGLGHVIKTLATISSSSSSRSVDCAGNIGHFEKVIPKRNDSRGSIQLANDLSRLRQENSELQARVDKCTRDSEQRNLVRDRHGFILRKERVNKLNGMQSTLTKRLEEIKQFEAKVYALLHVATNRFRSGEEKLRERNNNRCLIISIIMFFVGFPVQHCAEPRTQLKRLKDAHRQKERELKVTRVEMEKAKVITKVFKSLMVDENNQLRTEIPEKLYKKTMMIPYESYKNRSPLGSPH